MTCEKILRLTCRYQCNYDLGVSQSVKEESVCAMDFFGLHHARPYATASELAEQFCRAIYAHSSLYRSHHPRVLHIVLVMTEPPKPAQVPTGAQATPSHARPQNPVFRMMGTNRITHCVVHELTVCRHSQFPLQTSFTQLADLSFHHQFMGRSHYLRPLAEKGCAAQMV